MTTLPFVITVTDRGTAVIRRFGRAAQRAGVSVAGVGRVMSRGFGAVQGAIGGVIGSVFNLRNAIIGIGAGIAIRGIVEVFGGFEKRLNLVKVLTSATTEEFAALTAQAELLGATTQFSARQAAEGMTFLAKAGFEANEVLEALPKTLTLAAAANIDLATSADIVTNILSGLQLPMEDLESATDVLVQAFTSANTDLQQLGQAFKFVGPIATAAGLQFEEVTAALGLLGNSGIQASMAGTTLRQSISRLLNPSKDAAKIMKDIGANVEDASGKLLPFADILDQLKPIAGDAGAILKVFGDRAGPGMSILLSQGSEELRRFTKELENSGGRAAEVAIAQMQGLTGAVIKMKSAMEGAVIAIGRGLAPSIMDASDALGEFASNVTAAFKALTSTASTAGQETRNAFAGMVPEVETIIRALAAVNKAWLGFRISVLLVQRTFLVVTRFIQANFFLPLQKTFFFLAEVAIAAFTTIRNFIGDAFAFLLNKTALVVQKMGELAESLPGKQALDLSIATKNLAGELRGAAIEATITTGRFSELREAQTRTAERTKGLEDNVKLLDEVLKDNKNSIKTLGVEIELLNINTEQTIATAQRNAQAQREQAQAIKATTTATKQAAEAIKTFTILATLDVGTDPIGRFNDVSVALEGIGPNAMKAANSWDAALQQMLESNKRITPEQFAGLGGQLTLLEEIAAAAKTIPEEYRAAFDEAIPLIISGEATVTAITKKFADERSRIRRRETATQLQATGALISGIGSLLESGGNASFETQKKFKIAETIVNGLAASIRALELGPIAGPIAAAAILASTFATVQKIRATKPGGGGGGAGGLGSLGGSGGGESGSGESNLLVNTAEEAPVRSGPTVSIVVEGFVGNDAELASALAPVIREALGDDVNFGAIGGS